MDPEPTTPLTPMTPVSEFFDAPNPVRAAKKSKSKKWLSFEMPPSTVFPDDSDAVSLDVYPEADAHLQAGNVLTFLTHDMCRMFSAPSHLVAVTKGVVEYLNEYNQLGPNKTKIKLFCCTVFRKTGRCDNGYNCREVHPATVPIPASSVEEAVVSSSSSTATVQYHPDITHTTVHSRAANRTAYPRLPEGVMFRLSLPNTQSMLDDMPSEFVFFTKGSKDYYDQVMRHETPHVNMQHCAHFSKNGLCCFGEDCQFVHVSNYAELHPIVPPLSSEDELSNDTSSKSSSRGGGKKPLKGGKKETPLSLESHHDVFSSPLPGMQAQAFLPLTHAHVAAHTHGGYGLQQQHAAAMGQPQFPPRQGLMMAPQGMRFQQQPDYAALAQQQQQQQQQQFFAAQQRSMAAPQQLWAPAGGMPQQLGGMQPQQQYYVVMQQPPYGQQQQMMIVQPNTLQPQQQQQPGATMMMQQQPPQFQMQMQQQPMQQQQQQPQFQISQQQPQQQPQPQAFLPPSGAVGQAATSGSAHHLQHPFFQGLPN